MPRRKVYSTDGKKSAPRDYDEVKPKRAKPSREDRTHLKWWTDPLGKDAAATLLQWVDRQRSVWSQDAIGDLVAEAIYSDTSLAQGGRLNAVGRMSGGGMNPLNKIKSLVDTGTARLTKVRSMPVISADDATYAEKRFAREQSRVLRRKMGNGDMEQVAPHVIRDFIIRSTAWGKIERRGGDTEFTRVPSYEVIYDRREALHAKNWDAMSTIAHVRPVLRDELLKKYPHAAALINDAPPFTRLDPWMSYAYVGPNLADLVEVAEAWHPDDQTIVALRNGCVCRAPWPVSRYPMDAVYWTAPTRGVGRGTGLVYEQAAAQEWINDILARAREAIETGSQLKIFQPKQGGTNKHHLKARGVAVVEHDGVEPHYVAPDPVSKQAWAIAFQMAEQMEITSGISAWVSQGKNPLGANASGKALDTMDDIQSDRFAHVESGYQQWRVAIGLRHVDMARVLHDEANGKGAWEGGPRFDEQPPKIEKKQLAAWIRDNAWPDVDIDGGDYHLTLEPENFLVGTRGDRIAQVNELAKAGLIPDPSLTASMIDEPDIARMNRGTLGPVRRIEQCLSDLADLKVPYIECAPDPEMNLGLALLMVTGEIEQAKADKATEEEIQRFRDFRDDVKRLQQLAAPQSAPSLAGAQANNIVAQQNAGDLMGGGGGPPMGGAPSPGGAPPMMPPVGPPS